MSKDVQKTKRAKAAKDDGRPGYFSGDETRTDDFVNHFGYLVYAKDLHPRNQEATTGMMEGMRRTHLIDGESEDEGHKARKRSRATKPSEQLRGTKPGEEDNDEGQKAIKHFRGAKPSKWQKISNLMASLNDVLEEDGFEELSQELDRDTTNRCMELRSVLLAQLQKATSHRPEVQPPPYAPNIPSSLSALSITPWKPSEIPTQLPSLPEILDPTLEVSAFTHQGIGAGRITDLSYERLEWVGDSYLYITSTILISQTFPTLLPGKCSHLRERLIKNVTLADYARQYGFEARARLPIEVIPSSHIPSSQHPAKEREYTKIMGDIFEAYVAAVVLSDPRNGVARATEWLKKLWSMTLKKEIINEQKDEFKYDSPMWRLRGNVGEVKVVDSGAPVQLGPKEQLQKLLGSKGIKFSYRDAAPQKKDKTNKLPLFTVGVYLEGYGEKDKMLGYGAANGKKDAGIKAAAMALANKTMMKQLLDKKKIHDAQLEQERLALESIEGT